MHIGDVLGSSKTYTLENFPPGTLGKKRSALRVLDRQADVIILQAGEEFLRPRFAGVRRAFHHPGGGRPVGAGFDRYRGAGAGRRRRSERARLLRTRRRRGGDDEVGGVSGGRRGCGIRARGDARPEREYAGSLHARAGGEGAHEGDELERQPDKRGVNDHGRGADLTAGAGAAVQAVQRRHGPAWRLRSFVNFLPAAVKTDAAAASRRSQNQADGVHAQAGGG